MRSISFSENYKSFSINGDDSRVIRFNPADPNILVRADEAKKRISEKQDQITTVKLRPDGSPINNSEAIFAGQSPLCIVGDENEFLFEAFLNAAMPIIEEGVDEFNSKGMDRIERYTKEYLK